MAYGTLSVADLLATQATVVQLGEDVVFESIDIALQAHNTLFREKVATLAEFTTERAARYGGGDQGTMDAVDEFGQADAQKITAGSRVEFPMYLYQYPVQWTRTYLKNAEAREFAEQFVGAQDAHIRAMDKAIRLALFTPTNATVVDKLRDNVSLAIKRLVNADSAPLPTAFDGTTFNAATHTHYLFTAGATLANADMTALVSTVIEHTQIGTPTVWINTAQRTAVAALTGFIPVTPPFVTPAYTAASVVQSYDRNTPNNQLIGYLSAQNYAEVWVKPWIPAGYLFAFMNNNLKPLKIRTRTAGSEALVLANEDEEHPLRCRTMESEFGVACWNRTSGAVLFVDAASGGAYVAPAIT